MNNPFDKAAVNKVRDLLTTKHQTIAVAESVTAGLVQFALSSADEAIRFFQGGLTAYNLGQKSRHLNIEPIHAISCNCVSEQVASQMALHVCTLFNSNWGTGITGYASPVQESGNTVFCYYAIACNGQVMVTKRITPFATTPFDIQVEYTSALISALTSAISGS